MRVMPKDRLMEMAGEDLGTTDWFTIDQDRIDAFADATLDHQFIHVDEDQASKTPLGGTIAHGFLTLSLTTYFTAELGVVPENLLMMFNYGLDRLRFLAPVRSGSEVRARARLLSVTEKDPGRLLIKTEITVEIRGEEKPAMVAETLTLAVTGG